MGTLITIVLILLALILVFGIIRVITRPYSGFFDLIMEMVFLDVLIDVLLSVCEMIGDSFD